MLPRSTASHWRACCAFTESLRITGHALVRCVVLAFFSPPFASPGFSVECLPGTSSHLNFIASIKFSHLERKFGFSSADQAYSFIKLIKAKTDALMTNALGCSMKSLTCDDYEETTNSGGFQEVEYAPVWCSLPKRHPRASFFWTLSSSFSWTPNSFTAPLGQIKNRERNGMGERAREPARRNETTTMQCALNEIT